MHLATGGPNGAHGKDFIEKESLFIIAFAHRHNNHVDNTKKHL